jgi:3-phenylpropionate/trans-cinnamate dioxygenase ferredoxin reductase subunit
MESGVVIVGGGQAGARTAFELRSFGFDRPITIVGDEAHLPYERPILSKEMIADPQSEMTWVAGEGDFSEASITLLLDRKVEQIDRAARTIRLDGGSQLPYDDLVLATGGKPRLLAPHDQRICVLRTIEDALRIRALAAGAKRAVIAGGGVIGLEVASTLQQLGIETSVIELGPRLLGRGFPSELAQHIACLHGAAGIKVSTSTEIIEIRPDPDFLQIKLGDGAIVQCDFMVVGIGIEPNVDLARDAGLSIGNGILVDAEMQTSDPHIYAVGDCACVADGTGNMRRLETWQNANLTAAAAAAAIAGQPPKAPEVAWFWTDQHGRNIQLAGSFDDATQVLERVGGGNDGKVYLYLKDDMLVGVATVDAGREMGVCRRLIQAGVPIDLAILKAPQIDVPALQRALKAASNSSSQAAA